MCTLSNGSGSHCPDHWGTAIAGTRRLQPSFDVRRRPEVVDAFAPSRQSDHGWRRRLCQVERVDRFGRQALAGLPPTAAEGLDPAWSEFHAAKLRVSAPRLQLFEGETTEGRGDSRPSGLCNSGRRRQGNRGRVTEADFLSGFTARCARTRLTRTGAVQPEVPRQEGGAEMDDQESRNTGKRRQEEFGRLSAIKRVDSDVAPEDRQQWTDDHQSVMMSRNNVSE